MTLVLVADASSRTGQLVVATARRRGHHVRALERLDEPGRVDDAIRDASAIVVIPDRGDSGRHAPAAVRTLSIAAQRRAPGAQLLLVSSFAVGHGGGHPLNRIVPLAGRRAAERAVRASGLPWTIVRATWLTDDPRGAHAVTLTQDCLADGMLARADLAAALVAAAEEPGARGKTFALFNEPGTPREDWGSAFEALTLDDRRCSA
jgi:uncharacterized protein YbjT (DUF2867 family)